jgi:hypothetical protein
MRVKKAQVGVKAVAKKKAAVDSVDSEMFPGKKVAIKDIRRGPYISETKKTVVKKKMKDGGKSFPDLNKDGKITKADILKGRGVIKNGGNLKKAKSGASVKKKAMYGVDMTPGAKMKMGGKSSKKAMGGMKMMKGGGKCKYGC